MSEVNIFEQGVRKNVKIQTPKGSLNIIGVYQLDLPDLDATAIALKKQMSEQETESFIKKSTSKVGALTKLKFDIVKHMIDIKLEEEDKAKKRAENKIVREKLLQLKAKRQDESFEKLSDAEIDKALAEVEE